ncbi:hypothetical protein VUR80DRAFT_1526 [Thermomyces stellatus]
MGRRKIEIKAIKDDRNRSVTFLKRKGGLFKKAHELSVLCSVDVAVFIFGNNKKLYEYSSSDMRELITRYTYHGGPNEHKGPSDFGGGNDDEDTDDTPSQRDSMDPQMMPPHFQGPGPYPHVKKHTASVSPPLPNGVPYHPGYVPPRGHTPQPQMGSRPASRNDRRMGPNMVPHPHPSPQPGVNGYALMQNPAMYNPQNASHMPPHSLPPQHAPQYSYPPAQPPPQATPPQAHTQLPPQYVEDQHRSSMPPNYPQQGPHQTPVSRPEPSPRSAPQQLPPQAPPAHMSPPQPQPQQVEPQPQAQAQPQPQPQEPQQPPAPMEPKPEPPPERPRVPLLNTSDAIKRQPQRKQHSIFTPIDENRSILSQHLASFTAEPERIKSEPRIKNEPNSRSQSIDVGSVTRNGDTPKSPPPPQRANTQLSNPRPHVSIPETTLTPPSRSNSLKSGTMPPRPRLKVQIPDESSENGGSATADASSPRNGTETAAQAPRPLQVLPPPSPSATTLLSAGATGPPNPFARPNPHQNTNGNVNIDTPVSALPSRFLNSDFLPSPSSFYPDWNFRSNDSNTLPSPLNFTTPVAGTGPSFLRDENPPGPGKRKTPEAANGEEGSPESKRAKVD